jgi:hypothetical protein
MLRYTNRFFTVETTWRVVSTIILRAIMSPNLLSRASKFLFMRPLLVRMKLL